MTPKPPKGLMPPFVYTDDRMIEIKKAVVRYMNEQVAVPEKWIKEYNKLVEINKL